MHRKRFLDKSHRSYIPTFGVYTIAFAEDGSPEFRILSRQMVIFCVERRKAWRMLQSKAGIVNKDYLAQKDHLAGLEG